MYCYKIARLFDTACSYSNFYYPNANAMDGNSIDFLLFTIFLRIFGMGWPDLHIRNSIFYYTVHYIYTIAEICYCIHFYLKGNFTFCFSDKINRMSKIHINVIKIAVTVVPFRNKEIKSFLCRCRLRDQYRTRVLVSGVKARSDRCINLQNIIFLGVLLNTYRWGGVSLK